jgi:hypothetical protein
MTSSLTQRDAASFDDGASARFAASAKSTLSAVSSRLRPFSWRRTQVTVGCENVIFMFVHLVGLSCRRRRQLGMAPGLSAPATWGAKSEPGM